MRDVFVVRYCEHLGDILVGLGGLDEPYEYTFALRFMNIEGMN